MELKCRISQYLNCVPLEELLEAQLRKWESQNSTSPWSIRKSNPCKQPFIQSISWTHTPKLLKSSKESRIVYMEGSLFSFNKSFSQRNKAVIQTAKILEQNDTCCFLYSSMGTSINLIHNMSYCGHVHDSICKPLKSQESSVVHYVKLWKH